MIVLVIVVALVAIAVVVAITQWDRYRPQVRTEFTMPTTEAHVDPVTGARQRVYVNPATGERAFVDEPASVTGPPPLERPGLLGTTPRVPPSPPQLPPGGASPAG